MTSKRSDHRSSLLIHSSSIRFMSPPAPSRSLARAFSTGGIFFRPINYGDLPRKFSTEKFGRDAEILSSTFVVVASERKCLRELSMSKAPRGMVSGQIHDLIAQYEELMHLRAELASLLNRLKISPPPRIRGGTCRSRSATLRRLRNSRSASRAPSRG